MMSKPRAAALALAALMLLGVALAESLPAQDMPLAQDELFEQLMPTMPPEQPLRRAVFRAVGDVMSHDRQLKFARKSDGGYDYHPQYALVADCLAAADYTIANLETTVGMVNGRAYSGFPAFNAPEAMLDALKDAGVDFLTLANNHILDRGLKGVLTTLDNVDARGFDHSGIFRSQAEHDAPVVVEVNGIRVGFLCCTQMTNGMEGAVSKDALKYCVNYLRDMNWEAEVASLRAVGAEAVIAIPHWDAEYQRHPAASTVATAKKMIAAGVDVILGSHSHMVQPVEWISVQTADGGTRRGLVAYSLGNFCSNQSKQYTDSGIILEFTLREDQNGDIVVESPGFVPTFCWHQSGAVRTVPSLKYAESGPKGMSSGMRSRMNASRKELRALIGADIAMLTE